MVRIAANFELGFTMFGTEVDGQFNFEITRRAIAMN
jgi:hypothetical protein